MEENKRLGRTYSLADMYFQKNMVDVYVNGEKDENPRPKYADGTPAHSKFITQIFEEYDISKGEFPIPTLRNIAWKSAIKEALWIYQDQTSSLEVLKGKYNIHWWDDWAIEKDKQVHSGIGSMIVSEIKKVFTIGQRYGATIKKYNLIDKLIKGLKEDPYSRRHIINMWQYTDFEETEGLLPCAYETLWSVSNRNGVKYLNMHLNQRSSDFLTASAINKLQYVALMMMIAHECGYEVGKFTYFCNNLHIYDRHEEQMLEMLLRDGSQKQPYLKLNAEGKGFYDITIDDFELIDFECDYPQLKFELAI